MNTPKNAELYFRKATRVALRPVLESDIPHFMCWINDPEVHRFLTIYMPMMEADEQEWFERLHKRKPNDIVFTIEVEGRPIGNMGIHHIDYRQGTAHTGVVIGEKEMWGQGYGAEAKMLLLHYAFNTLNLRKMCSVVYAFNERSLAYSKSCGYVEEGRRKEQYYIDGQYVDEVNLAIFRKDWEPLWEQFVEEHKDSLKV